MKIVLIARDADIDTKKLQEHLDKKENYDGEFYIVLSNYTDATHPAIKILNDTEDKL